MRTNRTKALPLPILEQVRREYGRDGATVGLCHGCFDILHEGHVHHLRQAAALVDVLVVSVTPAEHVNKGPGRPVFGDRARLSVVAALEFVDHVVLNDTATAVPLVRRLRPDFFIKGADYEGGTGGEDPRLVEERDAVLAVGGRFLTTDGRIFDSSTRAARALQPTAGAL